MSLRQEIAKRLWQNYVRDEYGIEEVKDEYEYEYGVHNWNVYTEEDKKGYLEEADEILELIEKRIDSKLKTNKKIDIEREEILYIQGYNSAIYDIMEMLK